MQLIFRVLNFNSQLHSILMGMAVSYLNYFIATNCYIRPSLMQPFPSFLIVKQQSLLEFLLINQLGTW